MQNNEDRIDANTYLPHVNVNGRDVTQPVPTVRRSARTWRPSRSKLEAFLNE